jgi:hypothetical protein
MQSVSLSNRAGTQLPDPKTFEKKFFVEAPKTGDVVNLQSIGDTAHASMDAATRAQMAKETLEAMKSMPSVAALLDQTKVHQLASATNMAQAAPSSNVLNPVGEVAIA